MSLPLPSAPHDEASRVRVALMARSLRGQMTGVARYTKELVTALAPLLGQDLTLLLTQAPDGLDHLDVNRLRAPVATPNEYARAAWEQVLVPRQLASVRPHVYHSPNYILPLGLRCPTVVTVHDLTFFDRSLHRLRSHLYLSTLTTLAIRKATRIVCVSRDTRHALVERFPAVAGKVRVVSEGVSDHFRPRDAAATAAFRETHGLRRPFVLFVGTIEPRKNLARLVQAFEHCMDRTGLGHDLVIVGAHGWRNDDVGRTIERSPYRDRIRLLGYLHDDELPCAYSAADVFAYPSLHEGFGLPPLEAMACGTAVLTSDAGALPEVVGDDAVVVDPTAVAPIADGLHRLLTDTAARTRLAASGLARARRYRWSRIAQQTMDLYRELVP